MKIQSIFRLKSLLYLLLLGVLLNFSAFSCEVYAPLEIRIENRTGYDLTDIKIDEIQITSLKRNETSSYISTTEFEYLKSLSAIVDEKFKRKLESPDNSQIFFCGTGMTDQMLQQQRNRDILQSGKHTFVLTSKKNAYQTEGYEILIFSKK